MARDPGRLGCAAESSARSEPLLATASRVRRWLIIEQPGAWGRDALRESRLDPEVARQLGASAKAAGTRVILVRRSTEATEGSRVAFLARSDREVRWIEQIAFEDPAELTALDLRVLGEDSPPGVGEPGPSNLALVCTNGRHDPCCADFGRPVVRALRDVGVDVWESSHIGGDRFAANLVCLPTGVYFGRVDPDGAAQILADHDAGLLDLDSYRGRSCYPSWWQAAEILVRHRLGERRLHDLAVTSLTVDGDQANAVLQHRDDHELRASLRREPAGPASLTCSSNHEDPTWRYHLSGLED